MPPVPDRELRKMIVDLASLHGDDLDAVLDGLDASGRRTVERLLQDLSGAKIEAPPPGAAAACDLARFSPWMVRRLLADRADGEMTAHARTALNDCARVLYPAVADTRAPGAFAKLAHLVTGRPA
jgi:hypothetical protein